MSKKSQKHTKSEFEGVVVENLDAAAARLGMTREFLQAMKSAGCDAFVAGNRVRLELIHPWLADHPDFTPENVSALSGSHIDLRGQLIKQANDMQKLAERRKLFAKGEDVRASVQKAMMSAKLKFLSLPSKLAQPLAMMTDAREIQQLLEAEIGAALESFSSGAKNWFDAETAAKIERAIKS